MPPNLLAAILLIANVTSGSPKGVLTGTVRDEMTGEPLVGASVILDGTELGNATDEDGHYMVIQVPETTWTVTASYIGRYSATSLFNFTEGCTARLDFSLFGSYTIKQGVPLADSELALFNRRTRSETLPGETLIATQMTDAGTLRRLNSAKLALLARYRRGESAWTALAIGPYDSLTRRSLALGPGFCYYHEWRESPAHIAKPDSTTRRICGGLHLISPPSIYKVVSMTPGYFTETKSDGLQFVECPDRCPKAKLLFLKLALSGGGTALF